MMFPHIHNDDYILHKILERIIKIKQREDSSRRKLNSYLWKDQFHNLLIFSAISLSFQGDKIVRNLINTLEEYGFQYGNIPSATPIFKNYSNVQLRIKYLTQRSNLSEEALFKFQDSSFKLSPAAIPQKSGAVVVIFWYKTLHFFLKTKSSHDYGKICTKIITASIRPKPDPRKTFLPPVRISWNAKRLVIDLHRMYRKETHMQHSIA